jgi:hypothetical protein
VTLRVLGRAIQAHGAGVSENFPLAYFWTSSHALRLAHRPDEVYEVVVAKLELRKERKGGLVTEELEWEERRKGYGGEVSCTPQPM